RPPRQDRRRRNVLLAYPLRENLTSAAGGFPDTAGQIGQRAEFNCICIGSPIGVACRPGDWTGSSVSSASTHKRSKLRAKTARDVNRPAVGRELRDPVERAAVDERHLESGARTGADLKPE